MIPRYQIAAIISALMAWLSSRAINPEQGLAFATMGIAAAIFAIKFYMGERHD